MTQKLQITVVKTNSFVDLQRYVKSTIEPCPVFKEGQVFTSAYEKPDGFCDWAWNDIHPYVSALMTGGTFSEGLFGGWMKDPDTIIASCTDGIRPVVFEIKRINL